MNVTRLKLDDLDLIEPLWNELKDYHHSKTIDFDDYYQSNNFAKRKAELVAKDKLVVFVASQANELIGFCVASMNNGLGEIDSLYVSPTNRENGYGSLLIAQALEWLKSHQATAIRLSVGQGNEAVIEYYEKLGFKMRATLMELMN